MSIEHISKYTHVDYTAVICSKDHESVPMCEVFAVLHFLSLTMTRIENHVACE